MYTPQIQEFHATLTNRRIAGDIQNNELVWCRGKATVRALIAGKWQSVELRTDIDNTAAINKLTKIIDKSLKNAEVNDTQAENTNSTAE